MSGKYTDKINIILKNQHDSGSFISCPNFNLYKYCWLRDGSFTAVAMDLAGHRGSSDKYFRWTGNVIDKQADKVEQLIEAIGRKEPLLNNEFLPSRFTLAGSEVNDDWPNFQLDGYGIWLWALSKHMDISGGNIIEDYTASINLIVKYLLNVWDLPNYNCWEENGEYVNTSTLACIYGGLSSINRYIASDCISEATKKISEYVLKHCTFDGRLASYAGSDIIDASLLWSAVPFKMFSLQDRLIVKTVDEIEKTLLHGYGVHRYCRDTYYGGGEWLIMSCWLGWYYSLAGKPDKAQEILEWIESQANEYEELPEQSFEHIYDGSYFTKWSDMFGKPAVPSIWTHALYLILHFELHGHSIF